MYCHVVSLANLSSMTHTLPTGTVVAKYSSVENKEWDENPCIFNECSAPKPLADVRGHDDTVPLFNEAELFRELDLEIKKLNAKQMEDLQALIRRHIRLFQAPNN